jgi:hypothetical protein
MEVLKKTKDLLATLADVTEAGSKLARYKIEVANLDRKLGLAFKQVGERFYQLNKEEALELAADPEIREALKEVVKIRSRMEVINKEVGVAKDKALSDWDRASKTVKEEAGKASKVVKREADKASKAVKREADKASKAVKREAGKASKAVKREAGKAATLIKDETNRAASAIKKVGKKKPASKKAAAKKAPAKKAAAKKAPAKKAAAKKAPAKKAAAKKAPAKK